ncbi:hypothetical protein BT93_L0247 [Corymbia citriodora subsp. variegata]|uniref:Protein kinase domain-containing protein n=1 Tax=Corymbia citriodora subsp. variegata TaxID=360336 RepID=A0A8T0CV07_CORYI|nr:hypothetical protein BT93_L0247 [Corymbia citriodora subsp. variegata]
MKDGSLANKSHDLVIDLSPYPQYRLSYTRNNLTILGCDTYVLMIDEDEMFWSGCISYCSNQVDFTEENACSGHGCCQASIPKGLKTLRISLSSIDGRALVWQFNLCGVAFVVDRKSFNISNRTLPSFSNVGKRAALVLDWMVEWDVTCDHAMSKSGYACGNNANCSNFADGPGYRCFCKPGYTGNPYDRFECQEINECDDPQKYPCGGKCQNQRGSSNCDYPSGMHGHGEGTHRQDYRLYIALGGAELAKATENYDDSNKLGKGGFGSVYRARIKGGTLVAVKKPKDVHKSLMKGDFQHKLKIVMQINHKNVVKLEGICLETRIPLLVYEYISNGTLFQHIHLNASTILKSWKNQLKIAAEVALALECMHSYTESPIIHGNIKSANILLDQDYSVKISDFGTSVLISPEHSQIIATETEDPLDYIDPEYLTTGNLTIKSDVYSFGVVLMELLTKKKPSSSVTRSEETINIIPCFISSVEDKTLSAIINYEVASEDEIKRVERVAEIAVKCLDQIGANRPAMKEVAQQLARINPSPTVEEKIEENKCKLDVEIHPSAKLSLTGEVSQQGTEFLHRNLYSYGNTCSNCP